MTNFFLENNRCESIILDVAVLKLYYISGHVHLGKHNFPNQDRTFRGIESNVPRMISISLFSFFLCLFRFVAKNRIIARQIEWYQSQYCRDNAIVRYEVLEFSSLPPACTTLRHFIGTDFDQMFLPKQHTDDFLAKINFSEERKLYYTE